jgi:hypothetical protein
MNASWASLALVWTIGLVSATQAVSQQACAPTLALTEVQFSDMQLPTLERQWTAVVPVDASRCVVQSQGHFEIVFLRLKEVAPDMEFRERFIWRSPSVDIRVDFSADEAVGRYRIENITPCRCSG